MYIAIDVNDPPVAHKALHCLKNYEEFENNKYSLHTIYNSIKNSPENLHTLDTNFWDEMQSVIKNA